MSEHRAVRPESHRRPSAEPLSPQLASSINAQEAPHPGRFPAELLAKGKPKRLAILGSTGSIGTQTLDVVSQFPDQFQVVGLAASHASPLLDEQTQRFRPAAVATSAEGLKALAQRDDLDLVVVGTSGKAGFEPTLAALAHGTDVALANKETLIMAGDLVMRQAKATGAHVYPIDSEHSAIWQCLAGESPESIQRLLLTASGGPFRTMPLERFASVTPSDALKHPNWVMGRKITIDSATLMNKGLELLEARHLFDLPLSRVDAVIHPQSIVHSMVEFVDGSIKAQLGVPDMRVPIAYAIAYPRRLPLNSPRLEVAARDLTFEEVDVGRFPCLRLAKEAGARGGTYPTVLAAADEEAVQLFLDGHIGFLDIPRLVEELLTEHENLPNPTLGDILEVDLWARRRLQERARPAGISRATAC
ncbi:MAG TPA: 1-deoxy-D-xylulose-5-phosphate reductoisomerase [Chloroflexota bacterium]|nr:1-deoxy-D-xylulose-5-phosphate reductoisomerase [Chloroflexota bacterium]